MWAQCRKSSDWWGTVSFHQPLSCCVKASRGGRGQRENRPRWREFTVVAYFFATIRLQKESLPFVYGSDRHLYGVRNFSDTIGNEKVLKLLINPIHCSIYHTELCK